MLRSANLSAARVPPKTADPIYLTQEYAAWRARVIQRANGHCQKCGRQAGRVFADHIKELKDGGAPFDPDNGQCLCGRCHSLKTNQEKRARQGRRCAD